MEGWHRVAVIAVLLAATAAVDLGAGPPLPVSTPSARPPDVVLIVTDDQRADSLWAMPSLRQRLAAHGIRFRQGYVPVSLCCPARATLLTGRYAHTTGVWDNRGPRGQAALDESSTIAALLDDAGYRTALFGKYLNHWADHDPGRVPRGWDEWFAFTGACCPYRGFSASVNGDVRTFDETTYSTRETALRAAAFLREQPDVPTFVVWTPSAPHAPATPEERYAGDFADLARWRPPSYLERDVSDKPRWMRSRARWGSARRAEIDALRRRTFETLRTVDDGVGLLVDALEDSGRLSNTLLVYTSDNGVLFGEHRFAGKPFAWRDTHRVPFVVRYDPLLDPARTSDALVLSIDVAPTIVELASVSTEPMDGRSLVPLLSGDRPRIRSRFVIEHGAEYGPPPYCGVRSANAMFVRYATGDEEFYDYRDDPWELRNAVSERASRARVASLRRFAREHCTPRPPGFSW